MKRLRHCIGPVIGIFALCLASAAAAQESLGQGKSPAQLFASDCAICHKSPQGLAKSGGLFGLDGFLRQHYTASRETAAAIANYLKSMDTGPATPARAGRRTAKGSDKGKVDEKKKPEVRPGEAKGTDKKPEAKSSESSEPKSSESKSSESESSESTSSVPKTSEPKPAEAKAPEPKSSEPKASASPVGDTKPAEAAKSEKSE